MFKRFLLISTILISTNINNVRAAEDIENIPQKSASMLVDDNYNAWKKNVRTNY